MATLRGLLKDLIPSKSGLYKGEGVEKSGCEKFKNLLYLVGKAVEDKDSHILSTACAIFCEKDQTKEEKPNILQETLR